MPTFDGRSKTAAVTTATVVHIHRPTERERERDHTGRLTDIPTVAAAAGHNAAWPIGLEFQKSLLGSENFLAFSHAHIGMEPNTNHPGIVYRVTHQVVPNLLLA